MTLYAQISKRLNKIRQRRQFSHRVKSLHKEELDFRGAIHFYWEHLSSQEITADYSGAEEFMLMGIVQKLNCLSWHKDGVTETYYSINRIDKYNLAEYRFTGLDINYVWQLSRLNFLPMIGTKVLTVQDQSGYDLFKSTVLNWLQNNPFLYGVNWLCTMDVSIRTVNLIVGANFFSKQLKSDLTFQRILYRTLVEHAEYVHRFPEVDDAGYNNNHASAGFAGLLFVSLTLPDHPRKSEWLEKSIQGLITCCKYQTYRDGVNFEGSTSYHMLTLECFAYSLILCQQHAIRIGSHFVESVFKMFEYASRLIDCQGNIPQIGDNDSARFIKFESELDYSNILTLGEHIFDYKFRGPCKKRPEITNLCLPKIQKIKLENLGIAPSDDATLYHYKEGGITVGINDSYHILVCHQKLGQSGKGGHNHIDIGHFTLAFEGTQIIGDPGSFSYNRSKKIRDDFRSPFVHNMMLYSNERFDLENCPNFKLIEFFECTVLSCKEMDKKSQLTLEVVNKQEKCSRKIRYTLTKSEFSVEYFGNSGIPFKNYLIFHPECSIDVFEDRIGINNCLEMVLNGHNNIDLERIDYSTSYGVVESAYKLVISSSNALSIRVSQSGNG